MDLKVENLDFSQTLIYFSIYLFFCFFLNKKTSCCLSAMILFIVDSRIIAWILWFLNYNKSLNNFIHDCISGMIPQSSIGYFFDKKPY